MTASIERLISEGEHQHLDFKFAISDAKKIARAMVAFANSEGGKLLIGVKDNGSIYGIRSEEEYYVLQSAAEMYCKPPVAIEFTRWVVSGKTILEVTIPPGKNKPYKAPSEEGKWTSYIRVDDQNLRANNIQVRVWERRNKKRNTVIEYSEREKKLLEYIANKEKVRFMNIMKILKTTRLETEDILVNLISMNLVNIHITADGISYSDNV